MNSDDKLEKLREELGIFVSIQWMVGESTMKAKQCHEAVKLLDFLEGQIQWRQKKVDELDPPKAPPEAAATPEAAAAPVVPAAEAH